MILVTPEEMTEIDRLTIEEHGLCGLVLMENAARTALSFLPPGKVGILVGPGNNGGDGLVLARALQEQGRSPSVLLLSESLSEVARQQLQLSQSWGVPITFFLAESNLSVLQDFLADKQVLIDALFGTGLCRPIKGHWKSTVQAMNACSAIVVSIDIPSGINGLNGQVLGCGVQAERTVTFGHLKRGHLLYPGRSHCGATHLTQPGFHPTALALYQNVQVVTTQLAQTLLPQNWETMHKGDNGRLLLVTGSARYPGAGILTVLGALKTGAGLVTHHTNDDLIPTLLQWAPEAMPHSRGQELDLAPFHAAVIGSGLGADASGEGLKILQELSVPTVVDADSLPFVAELPTTRQEQLVLTPHPGELARMLNISVGELESDRIKTALSAAKVFHCVVCLKGAPTVSASPDGRAYVNSTGNPVLAQGGSGDLLAGVIGALLGFGLPGLESAAAGTYLHGKAADIASKQRGPRGVTAHQIATFLPQAYKSL